MAEYEALIQNLRSIDEYDTGYAKLIYDAADAIEELSKERKTGKWAQISHAGIYECSQCGQNVMTADIEAYKFCHGCGAKMEGCRCQSRRRRKHEL